MKNRMQLINFYITTIKTWSSISWGQLSGTFEVTDASGLPSGNCLFYVVLNAADSVTRSIVRVTNNTAWVLTFDYRTGSVGTAYVEWTTVQINDVAEIMNYLSYNTDDFGVIERITGSLLNVKVRWGRMSWPSGTVTVADQTLTMVINTTNNIYINPATDLFSLTTGLLIGQVVTNGTTITSITDLRNGYSTGVADGTFFEETAAWLLTLKDTSITDAKISSVAPSKITTSWAIDGDVLVKTPGGWAPWAVVGTTLFTGLVDVPSSYSGQAWKYAAVNSWETALEFVNSTGWYDAVVAASGGTHTSLASAVNSGAEKILVRNGTYAEVPPNALAAWAGLSIVCEGEVIINMDCTGVDKVFSLNWNQFSVYWGTWNITANNSQTKFVYTTTNESKIIISNLDITTIDNAYLLFFILFSNNSNTGIANCTWLKIKRTLWLASSADYTFLSNTDFRRATFTWCHFESTVDWGWIICYSCTSSVGCYFLANWTNTNRNTVELVNCFSCVAYFSRRAYLSNVSNCLIYWSNIVADANFNYGGDVFYRVSATGRCVGNLINLWYASWNWLKISAPCNFIGNSVINTGEYIQIGDSSTSENIVVNDNTLEVWYLNSGSTSKMSVKNKYAQVSSNILKFAIGSGWGSQPTLTIDALSDYSMIVNNIWMSWNSFAPSLTDNSTWSTVVNNLLTNS